MGEGTASNSPLLLTNSHNLCIIRRLRIIIVPGLYFSIRASPACVTEVYARNSLGLAGWGRCMKNVCEDSMLCNESD